MPDTASNITAPAVPDRIRRLPELASDLWWTWNMAARSVFRRLDYALWRQTAHNPVLMLRLISPEMLALAAEDPAFLEIYDAAIDALDAARTAPAPWCHPRFPPPPPPLPSSPAAFPLPP